MGLALFDLDNTLLSGDSDYEWGRFLADIGAVDREQYARTNARFHADYLAGRLDIHAFSRFSFTPLAENPPGVLQAWRAQFLEERIRPLVGAPALALVEKHRAAGDTLMIITATNSFVTRPIADLFGVAHLIATEPKRVGERFVPEIEGIPAFQEGKVLRLQAWLEAHPELDGERWFYSDSRNDVPLLERVDHPVAVDPDETLAQIAAERGWPVISLHGGPAQAPR
ncbi:HAD family hydrolase [Acidihalobacter ferrooxydans]|uniref:Phosphoserine phosphatase n=1 Tax=Acidihalobacter ferrooxydans TaxID=1765967 RepID=A0A1P8UEB4_9GAMM|nr:HAD family hydrolase [Acidihalobacter ferrooxydans]APZ42183.1 phosphoserine phosphatase [Acidihalobacter ferrooxydans]